MKKLSTILALTFITLICFSQSTIRLKSETVGFWTLSADTMLILKSDNVITASIYVPTFATDTVSIEGCTFTIDGIETNGVKIPPSEVPVNLGFKLAVLDSIKISSPGVCWVALLIDRE